MVNFVGNLQLIILSAVNPERSSSPTEQTERLGLTLMVLYLTIIVL